LHFEILKLFSGLIKIPALNRARGAILSSRPFVLFHYPVKMLGQQPEMVWLGLAWFDWFGLEVGSAYGFPMRIS